MSHPVKTFILQIGTINLNTPTGGTVGTAYNFQFVASGGTGPYTFALIAGAFPAGLNMNASGLVTGTPTTAGTGTPTIQVTDNLGVVASFDRPIAIAKAASTTSLASTPNPSGSGANVDFTATVTGPGGTPAGSVVFSESGTTLATIPLVAGVAVYSTNALADGDHTIQADYAGDANYNASSDTVTQTVSSTWPATLTVDGAFLSAVNIALGIHAPYTGTLPLLSGGANPQWGEFTLDGDLMLVNLLIGLGSFGLSFTIGGGPESHWRTSPPSNTVPTGNYTYLSGPGITGYPPGTITVT